MIQFCDDAAVTKPPTDASLQPLTVLLLFRARLDREAYKALLSGDERFDPISAPSIATAERVLTEMGDPHYAVLLCQNELTATTRKFLRHAPPRAVVVLREEGVPSPRHSDSLPLESFSRDTPWNTIARTLLGGADHLTPGASTSNADEARLASLTRRERQVLELVAGGASVRECSSALHIAVSTVDNHKSRLMKKIGVRKSSELVRFAFRVGIAP